MPEHIARLFMNSDYSDVTICVENVRLPVHKVVLASYDYFNVLLYGPFAETTQNVITLEDVGVEPFKAMLKYIYFGYVKLADLCYEAIFEILRLADRFLITLLTDSIAQYVKRIITLENVWNILELLQFIRSEQLIEACFMFAGQRAIGVLQHLDLG